MKTTEEMAVGFYMWMQQNGYDHNIKQRVDGKFEEYHQSELLKLNKSDVISSVCNHTWKLMRNTHYLYRCTKCGIPNEMQTEL